MYVTSLEQKLNWHHRFGHSSAELVKKMIVNVDTEFCVPCLKGKLNRNASGVRPDKPMAKIHMDSVGPLETRSVLKHRGFALLTDGYTHYRWILLWKKKSEIPSLIIKKLTELKNTLLENVKCIHSDQGTEFKQKEVERF